MNVLRVNRSLRLVFAPLAWLKLQYFCHAGQTEVAGFGITAKDRLLLVEDFVTVRQQASTASVAMDDVAVAEYLDRCVDAGLPPERVLRVWMHTHPGSSAQPSGTDEETFARVFGSCAWALMFIVSRTGETFARLTFQTGPGGSIEIPVAVDWSAWPTIVEDPVFSMSRRFAEWQQEFAANVQPFPRSTPLTPLMHSTEALPLVSPWEPFADAWDELDLDPLEDIDHEPLFFDSVRRA
jgi:hypothetical protein